MRSGLFVCFIALACSVAPSDGLSSGFGAAPSLGSDDDDGEDTDAASTGEAEDDEDPAGSSGAADDGGSTGAIAEGGGESGGGTFGGPLETSTSGAPEDPGGDASTSGAGGADQPASGQWSHCLGFDDCDALQGCLTNDAHTDGFCSVQCQPAGDPTGCPAAPEGSSLTCTLATSNGSITSVCALDCSTGQPCPNGMSCTETSICM